MNATQLKLAKQNISLKATIQTAGIELQQRGNRFVACCPFHAEKKPSFYVFQDGGFKCFGCGESGDVISFVMKFYNIDFMSALKHLGIHLGVDEGTYDKSAIVRQKKKDELIEKFEHWKKTYIGQLGDLINIVHEFNLLPTFSKDEETIAFLCRRKPIWEYRLHVLTEGSRDDQKRLYVEVTNGKS